MTTNTSWRSLSRALTFFSALALPSVFWMLSTEHSSWTFLHTALVTFLSVVVMRGALELVLRWYLPKPSLFGMDDPQLRADDITTRRRFWFWRFWFRMTGFYTVLVLLTAKHHGGFVHHWTHLAPSILTIFSHPATLLEGAQVMALFGVNFLIFMGPMLAMGISQMKVIEPGDAKFGVKLDNVRGQKEAKEEIRRVVDIWQSGEQFEKLGGKRERGMLFLGPPGVGKTLMAKAIATSFNSPLVLMPGSGFAQMFIGLDGIIVRFLNRKARKVSRKWGNQCIVFIDEIDAVGRRRNQLGGGMMGGMGGMMGGGMGQMALNQLLVVMDSVDAPPAFRMFWVKKFNTLLDAVYFVPRKIWKLPLRLPPLKPSPEQVYWLGATNIGLDALDPALVRAGRMGRHIYFRSPTKEDRKDVFDLYLSKVAHDPDLDSEDRRDEIARVTQGVSPASIEQICSMALTTAQNDGRSRFTFDDLVGALTTLEAGTAVGVTYTAAEEFAVAIHEAGHACAAHLYRTEMESSRLSVRMRGSSLGHHQSFEKEERFGRWRSEDFGELIHAVASMAAEYVFFDENGRGVSGDLEQATSLAAQMVGVSGMTPFFQNGGKAEEEVNKKFVQIGKRLINRTRSSGMGGDPIASITSDKGKADDMAHFLGHAFVTAYNFVYMNKDAVEFVAERLVEEKEIFGNDLNNLLDDACLKKYEYDEIENFHFNAFPLM